MEMPSNNGSQLNDLQQSSFDDDGQMDVVGSALNYHSQSNKMELLAALDPGNKIKRDSLKAQKKNYRKEKKKAAQEILSTLRDPSVILMADYLKVRGMLKSWTRFWCVLKPGVLILYKSQKQKNRHWVGTIILNSAKLIERPSKKDGFCFKIYHPLDQSIWAQKGPKGETYGAITQPLMYSSAIFRAPSESAGKTWMDALELALKCSSLLMRSVKDNHSADDSRVDSTDVIPTENSINLSHNLLEDLNESDREDHFKDLKDTGAKGVNECTDESDTSCTSESEDEHHSDDVAGPIEETNYLENEPDISATSGPLVEEFADENKNIIWCLMKQVRPGMDLSKVTLPTFILEPRSLLEKFADYYFHCDILSRAAKCDSALSRMIEVVRWYVSGFYKTPKGVKKPYNPILGERFRCYWKNEETNSRTFYIAEQISHHPPVTAFYVTNRQDGFSLTCTVLAKSKFYGNAVSAVMDGVGKLTLLQLGEEYSITMPYGYAKGIILGSLTMELGGKVSIECDKTGYRADLEFKLKPLLGSSDSANKLTGKIKLGHETLFTLDGRWDQEIFIKDKSTGKEGSFWKVDNHIISQRLRRYTVPMEYQEEFESERLWRHVREALKSADQEKATNEKFILEEAQRNAAKERKLTNTVYEPELFERDVLTGTWIYKYSDLRPWDSLNDIMQYEREFKVLTHTKLKTPLVRQMSIVNVNTEPSRNKTKVRQLRRTSHTSDTSTPSHNSENEGNKDVAKLQSGLESQRVGVKAEAANLNLEINNQLQRENHDRLRNLQSIVVQMAARQESQMYLQPKDWLLLTIALLLHTFLQYIVNKVVH